MSSVPSSRDGSSENPTLTTPSNPTSATSKRPRWKKLLTPIILAGLGLTLFLFALLLYPSATEIPAPTSSHISITTSLPIQSIVYEVAPVSQDAAAIQISANLPEPLGPTATSRTARLTMSLPPGTAFRNCVQPACQSFANVYAQSVWTRSLYFGSGRYAQADFLIKGPNFGVTFNGLNASAAIPDLFYQGTGTPVLFAIYHFPSASSYDWSSYPTVWSSKSGAAWQVALIRGDTAERTAVGIDQARQTGNDNRTFFAGALLGLAGGAIISAIQEALHARD